jgi:hypothetical protein
LVSNRHFGTVCACVGPVLDIQFASSSYGEASPILDRLLSVFSLSAPSRYIYLPCVYDSFIIVRPSLNLRDGSVASNSLFDHASFLLHLPFNSTCLLSLLHLLPIDYASVLHSTYSTIVSDALRLSSSTVLLGYASVFFVAACYPNFLVGEISQLCFSGVFRAIALGSTDGLSTWNVRAISMFQPVVVPVGRLTLGRVGYLM